MANAASDEGDACEKVCEIAEFEIGRAEAFLFPRVEKCGRREREKITCRHCCRSSNTHLRYFFLSFSKFSCCLIKAELTFCQVFAFFFPLSYCNMYRTVDFIQRCYCTMRFLILLHPNWFTTRVHLPLLVSHTVPCSSQSSGWTRGYCSGLKTGAEKQQQQQRPSAPAFLLFLFSPPLIMNVGQWNRNQRILWYATL